MTTHNFLAILFFSQFLTSGEAIRCYNGTSPALTSSTVSDDPNSNGVKMVGGCDYCTLTKSVMTTPMDYAAVAWGCGSNTATPSSSVGGDQCFHQFMISHTSQYQQSMCQCCEDGCNDAHDCHLMTSLICPTSSTSNTNTNTNNVNNHGGGIYYPVSLTPKCQFLVQELASLCDSAEGMSG